MAGRSATEMLWFAISVIVALALMGVFVGIAYQYSDSIQENARSKAADYYVNVDIVNDPAQVPYNKTSNNLTIYAKNTGKYELNINKTIVSVGGGIARSAEKDSVDVKILGNSTDWTQGNVARINVSVSLETGKDISAWLEVQGIYQGRLNGRDRDSLKFHLT